MKAKPVVPIEVPDNIEIVSVEQVRTSWTWLISNLSPRPDLDPDNCCIYDQKVWGRENPVALQQNDPATIYHISCLYLISQLAGDVPDILQIIKENTQSGVCIFTPAPDPDIKVIIENDRRFRHALSETLAFWVQLAEIHNQNLLLNFAVSLPNFHPEDKGPDGLSLGCDEHQNVSVEIRSAKSSIDDPYYLVASAKFREGGEAEKSKMLEEFHLCAIQGHGFNRLDRLLSSLCSAIGLTANQTIRAGFLRNQEIYNAFAIADDQHARYEMFSCYHRVSSNPYKCIATYIGSDEWTQLAENVRTQVITRLTEAGVW